jgi:hypothetical protein
MFYALTDMEITLDSIKTANEETQKELESTRDDMHTAYYAIGTKNELKEKNIINREGFLFFGKTELLKENFEKEYFAEIDIRVTDSLELFQPNIEVLTSHPENSFSLSADENSNMVLKIEDKDAFWSISRYLVVQAK